MSIYLRRGELSECARRLGNETLDTVLGTHKFSSEGRDGVTYEGEFQRALSQAGLDDDFLHRLTTLYTQVVQGN
jgi:hypothetical protein